MKTQSRQARLAPKLAVGVIGGALLLAACSPSSPGGATAAPGTGTGSGGSGAYEWIPGPLEEFTMRIWGGVQNETQAEAQARMDAEHRQREEMIVACMAEQGFQYNPDFENSGTIIFHDEQDGPAWGSREFAETYGFGIANDPWRMSEDDLAAPSDPIEWVDPNADLMAAMSDAERQAWQDALWGPPREWVDGESWDPMQAGCSGQAWGDNNNEQFQAISDELNNFWMTVESDSRWATINGEWASCMATNGYSGQVSPSETNNAMFAEWSQVQGWDAQNEIFNNWDWTANPDGPPLEALPQPDPQDVAAFTEREIAMAVVSYDCQQEVNMNQRQNQLQNELQQQFVDQHRAELEAWATHEEARRASR